MTADFVQTDSRGRSAAGTMQLKRPGKVRFQYGSGDLLLVANGRTLTFLDYQVGQKIELAAQPDAARPAAVELARFQRQGPDPAERQSACRRRCARADPSQYGSADARLPAQRLGARRASALRLDRDRPAEPPHDRQAVERPLQCRACRKAPSPTPSRRKSKSVKVSICDPFIAASGATRLDRSSILQVPGVSPCYPGPQDPLRDERLVGPRSMPPERGPFSYWRGRG